jgi:cytoskeletal protein CcmA (bactofilin family)
MLGRKEGPKAARPLPPTLLTVAGETARMDATFEIADSIQIECAVGGERRVGGTLVIGEKGVVTDSLVISKGGLFNGNVTKINEESAFSPRPVYLVEDRRAGQTVSR